MKKPRKPVVVFVIEDDPDERLFLKDELEGSGEEIVLHFFSRAEELVDFENTLREGEIGSSPTLPAIILANPFLKSQDIRQAVALMKSREDFRQIPQILILGAPSEEEFLRPYRLDVSGYVVKPVSLQALQQFIHP